MKVIGVTGGLGTGKSTVARMFGDLGAVVLNADEIVHGLMEPGTGVYRKIRARFGEGVLAPGGRIDRRKLGKRVFSGHRGLLDGLTRIVHPAVRKRIRVCLRQIRRTRPKAVVVLDIPLLIESGSAYRTDALVVVRASSAAAARRLKARSGWSEAEVKRRSAFQMPLREKERKADFVVNNAGSKSATRRQVVGIWKKIGEGCYGRREND